MKGLKKYIDKLRQIRLRNFGYYIDRFTDGVEKLVMFLQKRRHWFTKQKCIAFGITIGILVVAAVVGSILIKYIRGPDLTAVTVAVVEQKTVPAYANYVGTTSPVKTVDIRARVEGFLVERAFTEGDDVKEGDLMFVIDRRPFETELEKSRAQLAKDEAALAFANEQVARYKPLVEKDYVTRESYDQYVTKADEAKAAVDADRAKAKDDELNLSWCTMYSPLDGRIGRTFVHTGNLVGAGDDTRLATIVQLDPIYVYFSPSEEDHRKIMEHKQKGNLPVYLTFSDGGKYPNPGKLDFVDNVVDPDTATVKMRGIFPNPDKLLLPGIYVNVQLFVTDVPNTLLVPEEAVGEEQGGSYVLIVDEANKVEHRRIDAGPTYQGMRVIKKGVKKGEKVIIKGMQMVRPGMKVKPEMEESKDKTKDEKSS